MRALAGLITTLLSANAWSADVASAPASTDDGMLRSDGLHLGLSLSPMFEPPDNADLRMRSAFWGSVQLGYSFGHRIFHGPELEAGWWQFRVYDAEARDPIQKELDLHLGAGYRFGFDVVRWQTAALFVALRTSFGIINPAALLQSSLYLQAELTAGLRVALGPVRLRFTLGPGCGLYDIWPLVQVQAGVAVEL